MITRRPMFGMGKAAGRLIAGLLLCAIPVIAATASPGTGTRVEGRPATGSTVWSSAFDTPIPSKDAKRREVSQRIRKIANCLATKHRVHSAAYLAAEPASPDYGKILSVFNDKAEDCMSYYMGGYQELTLQMPLVLLRGLVAEAFLHQWPRPNLAAKTTVRESYSAPWMTDQPAARVIEEMAFCMAEMYPAESVELLSTAYGSEAQNAAVTVIIGLVPKCLQNGATLKTDAIGLRAAIALGIYHRIVDRPQPTGTAAGVH